MFLLSWTVRAPFYPLSSDIIWGLYHTPLTCQRVEVISPFFFALKWLFSNCSHRRHNENIEDLWTFVFVAQSNIAAVFHVAFLARGFNRLFVFDHSLVFTLLIQHMLISVCVSASSACHLVQNVLAAKAAEWRTHTSAQHLVRETAAGAAVGETPGRLGLKKTTKKPALTESNGLVFTGSPQTSRTWLLARTRPSSRLMARSKLMSTRSRSSWRMFSAHPSESFLTHIIMAHHTYAPNVTNYSQNTEHIMGVKAST